MPSLLDSGRIVFPLDSTSLSVKESARRCPSLLEPFTLPFSVRKWQKRLPSACPFGTGIRLHLKILQEPKVPISTMLHAMTTVYRTARLLVRVGSRETLTRLPNFFADRTGIPNFDALLDLNAGPCNTGQALTAEQTQLYGNRNNVVVGNLDIVVYFVRSLNGAFTGTGCAAPWPTTNVNTPPSCAVAQAADRWVLAHEVGHVLGLSHLTGETCSPSAPPTGLMTACGTRLFPAGTTPTLSATEINTMQTSRFTQIVVSGF